MADDLRADGQALGTDLFPVPLDWDEYATREPEVRRIAEAAINEVGGQFRKGVAAVTEQAHAWRAYLLGLQATGVPYELVDAVEYLRQIQTEWHARGKRTSPVEVVLV